MWSGEEGGKVRGDLWEEQHGLATRHNKDSCSFPPGVTWDDAAAPAAPTSDR